MNKCKLDFDMNIVFLMILVKKNVLIIITPRISNNITITA